MIRALPNRNGREFQTFYIRARSGTDSAQWDWGIRKRNILILGGNLNAKTGSAYTQYPTNMGRFGKGKLNSNGEHLLELASRNDLILTNTIFNHKMAHSHRTTWVAPERKDTDRRNPISNQIDYILVRKNIEYL